MSQVVIVIQNLVQISANISGPKLGFHANVGIKNGQNKHDTTELRSHLIATEIYLGIGTKLIVKSVH